MTDKAQLFTATKRGVPFVVGFANEASLKALRRPIEATDVIDLMEPWAVVAINGGEDTTTLHALGWRVCLGDVWITSALRAIDLTDGTVRTSSGKVYALGNAALEFPDLLQRHLACALRTW